jgi:hypothetical protein
MPFLLIGVIFKLNVKNRCVVQVKYSVTKRIGRIVVPLLPRKIDGVVL